MYVKNQSVTAERDDTDQPSLFPAFPSRLRDPWRWGPRPSRFVWPELPAALHETQPWGRAGVEPPLHEVLADPVIQAIMRRDGVAPVNLESIIIGAKARMQPKAESD